MHRCPECQKEFPRPSGLKTHMNTHTKEKPFPCTYPGCSRTFSVVSNAKRHMRTHGLGVSEDGDQSSIPYVVGFEEPMVAGLSDAAVSNADSINGSNQPFRLKWIPSSERGRPEMSRSAPRVDSGTSDFASSRMRGWSADEG
ncbi:hypothetical protein CPB84DRAFT_1788270 [Gymnopilus junonius]|uniref:C2H2-type domain-containing protein n=1 Tax=Gymnopilus junonius TaxID=109634 RepID=A0A9P5TKD6_GYMJU|nr:hypothetical protein CPB84DRAFT_1788270 [Gymnopilus junonius]